MARLAGIPGKVTDRAYTLLAESLNRAIAPGAKPQRYTQLLIADDSLPAPPAGQEEPDPVLAELSCLDPDTMTPIQALAKLAESKALTKKAAGKGMKEAER